MAGNYLSFDANLAFSGFRSAYYVFGSIDGKHLIYGVNIGGNLSGNYLPRAGAEAAKCTGKNAGFTSTPGRRWC